MKSIGICILALTFAPLAAFAGMQGEDSSADSPKSEFRVINPQVNAWARGTVSKLGSGELVIEGTNMPFATARAQMHQEMRQKLAGIDDAQQRLQIMKQVKNAWDSKLDAALTEKKAAATALTFKKPADSEAIVVLDAKSIRELPFFQKLKNIKESREKLGLSERTFAELYEAREERMAARAERRSERPVDVKFSEEKREAAAENLKEKGKERVNAAREKLAGEQLSINDLKPGDEVFIGYNSKDNTAYTIVRNDKQSND
jgi:hypothetical protein